MSTRGSPSPPVEDGGAQDLATFDLYGGFQWGRPVRAATVVLRDRDGNVLDDRFGHAHRWYGSPIFQLYYPMQVQYEAAVVP